MRGDRLRQAREKIGITQKDLSRACGLADNMIYRYESGLSDITGNSLKVLAAKLGVNSDYLLGLSDDPNIQTRDSILSEDERIVLEIFRSESWQGIARLSVAKLSEPR